MPHLLGRRNRLTGSRLGNAGTMQNRKSRDSTKMFELLPKLSAAIQTKQQFEEQGEASPEAPAAADEDEQDMEL